MVRISIHVEAEAEIIQASQYYGQKSEELGERFLDDLESAIGRITDFPQACLFTKENIDATS